MEHCDRRCLEEFFRGGEVDGASIAEHLALCSSCYRSAVAVVADLGESGFTPGKLTPLALAFWEIIQNEEVRLRAEVRAKCLVSLFLSLDADKRRQFVRSDPRMKSHDVVLALIRMAREKALSDPALAVSICNYSLILIDELRGLQASQKADLAGETLTEMANARRLQADRDTANQLLDRAYQLIVQTGTGKPVLVARIGSIRASVRLDAGRPDEALLLLQDVRQKYESVGATHEVGRILVQIGDIVSVFDPSEAYRVAREAIGHLGRDEDLRPRACALGMMVECLIEQGRAAEALREYRQSRSFLEQFSEPAMQVRVRVLEARLAALASHDDEALQLFTEAIDEFFERGLYQAMTNTQLLLLGFYIDRKRWAKAVELCSFAAKEEEVPEGVRRLWENLENKTRTRLLEQKDLQETRRLLRAEWG